MAAVPARTFSSSVGTLLLSASPAAGNGRRGAASIRSSVAASKTLLPNDDIELQVPEGLIKNVRQTILHHRRKGSGREMLAAVDNLKRLCIDHHFEEEIESAVAACTDLLHSDDLLDATRAFRLMREAGHHVSADDILRKFTDGSEEFSLAHNKDIRGLLSLHDMSHLNIGEEASLYKAKEFSRKHLRSAIRYLEPSIARYVRQSLDHPYHLSIMQYKARHHLSYLQSLPNSNTAAMEELAIAEFQLNKQLHQIEMQEAERWWMGIGLAHELPVIRDEVLKWYMWALTMIQGSPFSKYRVEITKIISFVYVVDDIFDLVGTPEELSRFTDAIKSWDLAAADSLPTYMRSCYKALCTVTNEIAEMAETEHGLNPIDHLKKAWSTLLDGYMAEAKWLAADEVPSAEDYLRNGAVTSGLPLVFAHVLVLLDVDAVKKLADDHHIPRPVTCAAKILRLHNDMARAKEEEEGLDGSYRDLYLLENPSCDAEEHMLCLIAREWEELNRECLGRRRRSSTQACLNAARMISVMYGYNEEKRLPVLEDYIRTFLL